MDLILMDPDRTEEGVLHSYTLDYEANTDATKCTFQIKNILQNSPLKLGQYWYIDGTEYGGRIDAIKVDTSKNYLYAKGRSWRGMLASKVLIPAGDYYTVDGDVNDVLMAIVLKIGMSSIFTVPEAKVKNIHHQFKRYEDAYSGIIDMLAKNGLKLIMYWKDGTCVLTAAEITDWSNEQEMSSDIFDFIIEKNTAAVNHMIGLGRGELSQRQVVHRYTNDKGEITSQQFYFGEDEIIAVNDYPNAESIQELTVNTEDKLKDAAIEDGLKITSNDIEADIGDTFTASERTTGTSTTQQVVSKIATITEDTTKINYKVGGIL